MMTAPTRPALVESYLDRLLEVSGGLPASRRRELLDEVAAHLDDLVASTGGNEAALRTALERFGSPEDIVRAEGATPLGATAPVGATMPLGATVPMGATSPAGPAGQVGQSRGTSAWGGLEIATVALLLAGISLLPAVGTLAALVCLWLSRQWSQLTKLGVTALAVVPGLAAMVLLPVVRLVLGFRPGFWDRAYPILPSGLEGLVLFHGLATVAAVVWLVVSLSRRTGSSAPSRG